MCLIIIKPAGVKRPSNEQIINMCNRNSDGFGMATWTPNKGLRVKKTMNEKEYLSWCEQVTDEQPCIFHARIATHGSIGKKNCHPFIADDKSWAFAHNGILSIANEKDMTDSETFFRRFAMPLIKAGHTPTTETFDKVVEAVIGTSKFAFLNNDGQLFYYGNYIHENGCLYSNTSYQYSYGSALGWSTKSCGSKSSGKSYPWWYDWDDDSYLTNTDSKSDKDTTNYDDVLGDKEMESEDFYSLIGDIEYALSDPYYEGLSDAELLEYFSDSYEHQKDSDTLSAISIAKSNLAFDMKFEEDLP